MTATPGLRAGSLQATLENAVPASIPAGQGTAVFCYGTCFHPHRAIERLAIAVDGEPHPAAAWAMPRLDVFGRLHPRPLEPGPSDPESAEDPEVRGYRSGFWGTVPVTAKSRPGTVELLVVVRLDDGTEVSAPLGEIPVVEPEQPAVIDGLTGDTIAVCMATFEPDPALLRTQLDSLREQTHEKWICLISDDCSAPESFDEIRAAVGDDPRFVVSRSPERIGFYRNFERALRMVPQGVELIALSDQDDRWLPEKLETLRTEIGQATLVYSDQRLVDAEGNVLRDTLWVGRRNDHANIASLLIANSMTGASMLFRREVAEAAIPFPEAPGLQFHDHWLGLVAMALGEVAYVDRPLYDYVQHGGAVLGKVTEEEQPRRRQSLRAALRSWRVAYFWGFAGREVLAQALLVRCGQRLTAAKRRALRRFIASGRSPLAFAWLLTRPLRRLAGRNETLGSELELAQGIAWRWLVSLRAARLRAPGRRAPDTAYPLDMTFEQKRLRRWREQV